MEKLKFYFSDETTLTIPENIPVKYIINSVITPITHNISIAILHKVADINLLLREIYVNNIKDKVVLKVERYNENTIVDSIEGTSLTVVWNLGNDIVAGEEVYNEVIDIGGY